MNRPLGLFYMGKSYPGQHFSTNQILLFCSYGETLSRLPGKVSGCDVALNINWIEKLLTRQNLSYSAKRKSCVHKGKTLSRSPRCRLSTSEISVHGRTFVSYERSVTFHIFGITRRDRISLVNLSKSFLANRDNFCIYEQALRPACFIRRISVASNAVQTI
jgi:hypothetical protein